MTTVSSLLDIRQISKVWRQVFFFSTIRVRVHLGLRLVILQIYMMVLYFRKEPQDQMSAQSIVCINTHLILVLLNVNALLCGR
ncbi:MAG: hypothetical protein AMJ54_11920 [Deltaproteobacteria bacterium SG8_13]|nr:MAG: hypothetical protein AMJ54_11920 [Deltaproteobacteria bacterium SG8_13]